MKLTYGLLEELLRKELDISRVKEELSDRIVEEIALYPGEDNEENKKEKILYLTDDIKVTGEKILLVTDKETDQWHVTVSGEKTLAVISRIISWYQHFVEWQHRCTILAEVEHDLGALLEEGMKFLGTRWMIVDREYRYVEVKPAFSMWEEMFYGDIKEIPGDVLEELYYTNPKFDDTFQTKGICIYHQDVFTKDTMYYYNIFQETFYLGRILMIIPQNIKIERSVQVLEFLCQLIEDCYQYIKFQKNQNRINDMFAELFQKLLNGNTVSEEETETVLKGRGWKREQKYELLCLASHGYVHSEQTLEYYAQQMEKQFADCGAVCRENRICCIHNLSLEKDKKFRQKLSGYIRENLFKVGISNPFYEITEADRYKKQAEKALDIGRETRTNLWRYDFADYVSEYTMQKCTEEYPAEDLCPANLRKIMDYDRTHEGSQLTETLYHYYTCNFNAQKAAEKLFVHRTTFFYRMSKIQKLAAFHIEDPGETCQILLALMALKDEQRGENNDKINRNRH